MKITWPGFDVYAYTGGKSFNPAQPTVVFIHGVLNDHSVWVLQTRYLAHHGWNVLAIDLPGHARSQGPAAASVEEAADQIHAMLDAAGLDKVALVGHSWGSLIALEAAARMKERATHVVLIGSAFPMPVAAPLLEASQSNPEKAIAMINVFSRATLAAPPSAMGPGTWVHGASTALNRRILASNPTVNLFHLGFNACNNYSNGLNAMAALTGPVLFINGAVDQMTPPKATQALLLQAKASGQVVQVVTVPMGHHQMNESPEETLQALRNFLR
jgi:predicted esterase